MLFKSSKQIKVLVQEDNSSIVGTAHLWEKLVQKYTKQKLDIWNVKCFSTPYKQALLLLIS